MKLRCPQCRLLIELPHRLERYFGMPLACYHCRHVFRVPERNPSQDRNGPQGRARPLGCPVSAERSNHERECPACDRRIRIPGPDPDIGPLDLSCPYCGGRFTLQAGRGGHGLIIMLALAGGIGIGLLVLWLDNQGLIALDQLRVAKILIDLGREARLILSGWW